MPLLTRDDIVTLAFNREIQAEKIKTEMIDAVQERHIMPVLGETFYDLVVAAPTSYTAVVNLIKPIVAYFVKYYIIPQIFVELSTTGANVLTGQNRSRASEGEVNELRNAALDAAAMHLRRLSKYLDDNSETYTDYYKTANADEQIEIAGGIIFEKKVDDDDTDDYTINLKYY